MHSNMQGLNRETTYMKLEGKTVSIMNKIYPSLYEKNITIENKKEAIYVKLKKALYGTVQASLLFWQNLTKTLINWGFKINFYDSCVANKTVKGKKNLPSFDTSRI